MINLTSPNVLPAVIHNLTLKHIGQLASFPGFTLEEAYNSGVSALNDTLNPGTTPFPSPNYSTAIAPYYTAMAAGVLAGEIIVMLDTEYHLSAALKQQLLNLNNLVNARTDFDNFDSDINSYIAAVESSTALTADEKSLCVGAANISIASKNFWVNAHEDVNDPWHPVVQDDPAPMSLAKGWFKKVCLVVACDLVGGALGALAGSLLGPAGAVAGASVVAGGASGAATKNL
jgi:hypothetical protein